MTKWEHIKHKLVSQEEAKTVISSWKNNEEKVVFTNGCFDILHRGHITYLAKAASKGDYLVVGVNADDSVKRLNKAPNRPVNDEQSRALVIASLEVVDLVVIFENDTPKELIETIEPSILIKGADYDADIEDESNPKYIVGAKEVKAAGGTVDTIDLEEGFSTTRIIERLK
ncbi:D-glycero-beta-D-manno-heptose 1-phosphate adenylyltransferase [Brumimicrobium aurantiacum]|uniref:D-glycero-beta-D-manno-heptose 1-phosphate adenylyltransferase n=1 Tax=Brumimicrobium aurantiacum TaxID=1737063 RepID=A0A3E1EXV7_9FLAO|nr:D-glycero-beta-D-manno-heptose 1-phosphate adenylyltransferase [Brumimicrobium aurantiacum]RFC54395.1 D-glycero-beta-D-manno-heptose 1-phosphate adenylyltransferase [Brumimicrobium aurantiacum]